MRRRTSFRHHIGATYVALERGAILGFATVAASHVEVDGLPAAHRKRLPRYPLPILRLARLAIAQSAQRKGVGRLLLRFVFRLALEIARRLAAWASSSMRRIDAIDFYRALGFEELAVLEGALGDRPQPTASSFRSTRSRSTALDGRRVKNRSADIGIRGPERVATAVHGPRA